MLYCAYHAHLLPPPLLSVCLSIYLPPGATSRRLQAQANLIEAALQAQWGEVVALLQSTGTPSEDAGWWFFAAGMAQFFR